MEEMLCNISVLLVWTLPPLVQDRDFTPLSLRAEQDGVVTEVTASDL